MSNMIPLQYSVYKGMGGKNGALQLSQQLPHFYCAQCKVKNFTGPKLEHKLDCSDKDKPSQKREGCLFMDITSTKDKNVYDWDNKIVMALSISDLGKILFTLVTGQEAKITHDPGAKTERSGEVQKYLTVTSPKGVATGVIFRAAQVVGEDRKEHTVPLDGAETLTLRTLIQAAITRSLAW